MDKELLKTGIQWVYERDKEKPDRCPCCQLYGARVTANTKEWVDVLEENNPHAVQARCVYFRCDSCFAEWRIKQLANEL